VAASHKFLRDGMRFMAAEVELDDDDIVGFELIDVMYEVALIIM
jgi:hypothetical protein